MVTLSALGKAVASAMPAGVTWFSYEIDKKSHAEIVIETVAITLSEDQKVHIRRAAEDARPAGHMVKLRFVDNVQVIEGTSENDLALPKPPQASFDE